MLDMKNALAAARAEIEVRESPYRCGLSPLTVMENLGRRGCIVGYAHSECQKLAKRTLVQVALFETPNRGITQLWLFEDEFLLTGDTWVWDDFKGDFHTEEEAQEFWRT